MRDQFLDILKNFREMDVATTPTYITMMAIAHHKGAEYPQARTIASKLKIEVSQSFIDDKELFQETVDTYVSAMNKIWLQLSSDFEWNEALSIFHNLVSSMTLTYTF